MTNVVLNGNAYSDDGSAARDMQGGGHRQWLLPMLGDAAVVAGSISASVGAASASAAAALDSKVAAATSATNAQNSYNAANAIGSGWTAVTQAVADGSRVVLQVTNWVGGKGTKPGVGYVGATGIVATAAAATNIRGSTDYSDLAGKPTLGTASALDVPAAAAAIATSAQVVRGDDPRLATNAGSLIRSARSSNATLVKSDIGRLIDVTSGTFNQAFASAATLASGWWVYVRNSGSGFVTLLPSGSQTIDGALSYVMYPGECRLIQCDGSTFRTVILTPLNLTQRSSFDFSPPPGYRAFRVEARGATGGGGSGGSGLRNSSTNAAYSGGGGGAGGAGGRLYATIPKEEMASPTSFIIGSAGGGGAAVTTPAVGGAALDGNSGTAGGTTSFEVNGWTFSVPGGDGGKFGSKSNTSSVGVGGDSGGSGNPGVAGGAVGTGTAAQRYDYDVHPVNGAPIKGLAGTVSPAGDATDAPGGAGALSEIMPLSAGAKGAGGAGGPGAKNGGASVSVAGGAGVSGMVIITGLL